MALGNSNSSSKSRGKNKPAKIKRRREVKTAKDYSSFNGSLIERDIRNVCRLNPNVTYYFNGSSILPRPSDIIYREKRARSTNRIGPGYIHFLDSFSRSLYLEIDSDGVVQLVAPCR